MNLKSHRTAKIKAFLIAEYKKGYKKNIYDIDAFFKQLNIPLGYKVKKAYNPLLPLEESGFISIIRTIILRSL